MEEMEDKDIKKAKEKARLNKGSTHIIEPSDEEDTKKPLVPWQEEAKKPPQNKCKNFIPISYYYKYRTP